uniref:Uncharacterized protein n=1 Tax=Chromera velia CCMP2878 TaxID=1169474 RepID=A0A0G4HHY4_9ALVE|eukprot:Cvel_27761.t1-p1 / transcript=Cvel_27761.t1 / gene=Cvel_27761 / organism=Chromera_velia_CCMP2878 / gene_product=hypothetical protein / transcript_product=hypothetical protein / location=Cvel_scaffold3518:11185-15268(+) / protein_length=246 / sequence_SO=supercontig / SO=protein_coding / is_pseudo=false
MDTIWRTNSSGDSLRTDRRTDRRAQPGTNAWESLDREGRLRDRHGGSGGRHEEEGRNRRSGGRHEGEGRDRGWEGRREEEGRDRGWGGRREEEARDRRAGGRRRLKPGAPASTHTQIAAPAERKFPWSDGSKTTTAGASSSVPLQVAVSSGLSGSGMGADATQWTPSEADEKRWWPFLAKDMVVQRLTSAIEEKEDALERERGRTPHLPETKKEIHDLKELASTSALQILHPAHPAYKALGKVGHY